jgi:hypothetical protein
VIPTTQHQAGACRLQCNCIRAMATDVVERADDVVLAADEENRVPSWSVYTEV